MLQKLRRYYYTIKYISFSQFLYRLFYTFKRKRYERIGPRVFARLEKGYAKKDIQLNPDPNFVLNDRFRYFEDLEAISSNQFTFLKKTKDFGYKIDWHPEEFNYGTRLWKMNLNYMEYLWDVAKQYKESGNKKYLNFIASTIEEWHRQNPIGTKTYYRDNWNSYSISFRLSMWIKIYTLIGQDFEADFKALFKKLFWIQAEFLYENLELDLLGNHVLKNWMALYTSGVFLKEPKYIHRANQLFDKFVVHQFTKNYNHEELSPMYAAIVLEDLMEVFLFNKDTRLKNLVTHQFKNVIQLTRDQAYAFFNDSVNQNGILPQQLADFYYKIFPAEKRNLKEASPIAIDGYCGFRNEEAMFVFDGGKVIEGNQAAHVHCDALSFEFYLKDKKVFTNSGTYEYDNTKDRNYSRCTASHNTLQYGELEQSEIWSSFRLARRATITSSVLTNTNDQIQVEAELEGFNFNKKIKHQRSIEANNRQINILDKVKSNKGDDTKSKIYFHLAPPFQYVSNNGSIYIKDDQQKIAEIKIETAYKITDTAFYPTFGKSVPKQTLILEDIPTDKEIRTEIEFLV